MSWERSERFAEFGGCRLCVHYRRGSCVAYPERIPLDILSGEVDHMVKRPGQVGETVFELMDLERWQRSGERTPLTSPTARTSR